jgi:uncharacterized membrane protein
VSTIEKSIDVHVPVTTAYNQWTQFESFPRFMEGVEAVVQETDTRSHWRTKIAGVAREFDAEITEQRPDERVAWRTVEGTGSHHGGAVTFHRIADDTTRVMLQMDFDPQTLTEKAGDAIGIVGHRVAGDLERFKTFIESQGSETGAWRGEVPRAPQRGEHGVPAGTDDPPGGASPRGETPGRTDNPAT